jgi:acetylornithine deacetylase
LSVSSADGARIEYLSIAEPVRLFAPENFAREVVRFTTDIPYLSNWGTPLLLGPGSILDAHTARERVRKDELTAAVELYARLVRELRERESSNGDLRVAPDAVTGKGAACP